MTAIALLAAVLLLGAAAFSVYSGTATRTSHHEFMAKINAIIQAGPDDPRYPAAIHARDQLYAFLFGLTPSKIPEENPFEHPPFELVTPINVSQSETNEKN